MGYGSYQLPDGRWAGYNIEAECDHPECHEMIDRGLGFLCGRNPNGHRDPSEPGCGDYFCGDHSFNHDCPNPEGDSEDVLMLDYPTAWALQREVGDQLNHHPKCSSVEGSNNGMGGPAFLCDCGALIAEHERREAERGPSDSGA